MHLVFDGAHAGCTESEANDIVCNFYVEWVSMKLGKRKTLTRRWNALTVSVLRNLLRHADQSRKSKFDSSCRGHWSASEEQVSKYGNSKSTNKLYRVD